MELLNSLRDTLDRLRRGEPAQDLAEKRHIYRVRCLLPATVVLNPREAVPGQLVNLSTRGMKLHLQHRLKTGQLYSILLRAHTTLDGQHARLGAPEVRLRATALWCKKSPHLDGYDAGFIFFSFADMRTDDVILFFRNELQVAVPNVSQQRRYTRVLSPFAVEMTHPDAASLTGRVRDLSLEGVQWSAERAYEHGTRVTLTLSLGNDGPWQADATVMRCLPDPDDWGLYHVGARFEPLSPASHRKLARVVRRYLQDHWGSA